MNLTNKMHSFKITAVQYFEYYRQSLHLILNNNVIELVVLMTYCVSQALVHQDTPGTRKITCDSSGIQLLN